MQPIHPVEAAPALLNPVRAREIAEALLGQIDPKSLAWLDRLAERGAPPETFEAMAEIHLHVGDHRRALSWFARYCLAQGWASGDRPVPEAELEMIPYYLAALAVGSATALTELLLARLELACGDLPSARRRLKGLAKIDPEAKRLLTALRPDLAGLPAERRGQPSLPALIYPLRRHRFRASHVLAPFARADRGDLFSTRAFSEGWSRLGWVFPVHCGVRHRLIPPGHPASDRFLFDAIPAPVLKQVRKGRGVLLIDHGEEGMFTEAHDEARLAPLLPWLADRGLAGRRTVILDGNLNTPERLQAMARAAGAEPPEVVADRHLWLRLGGSLRRARREGGGKDVALLQAERRLSNGSIRPKTFLSFNNAPRPHRIALVATMLERGWLGYSLVSFHGPGYARERHEPELTDGAWAARASAQCAGLVDLERPELTFKALLAASPLSVDVPLAGAGRNPWSLAYGPGAAWPFLDTYVSLVTDTFFSDGRSQFVSEKPLRAVANLHPFIYFGDPGALADLRARGYRTFAPLIDETYDSILSPRARMQAALKEVGRLAAMGADQLQELYASLWPTLTHNYRTLVDGAPAEAERIANRIAGAIC